MYTIVDIYDLCTKFKAYLNSNSKFNVHKSIFEFLDKIIKIGNYYLNTVFLNLIQNPDIIFDWPNLKILKECFTEFLVDTSKNISDEFRVINYYYINFDMVFDINSIENLPEYITYVKGIDSKNKEYDISDHTLQMIKLYNAYRKTKFGMVEYIAERHRKKYQ